MINEFLKMFSRTRSKAPIVYSPELETIFNYNEAIGSENHFYEVNFSNTKLLVDAINERYSTIRPLHFLVVGPMQSGKTKNIECFLETSCGRIPNESRLFTCGDGDIAIREQNEESLSKVIQVKSLQKYLTAIKSGRESLDGIKLLIIEEDQFGQGENSKIHKLLTQLYNNYPDLIVIRITGTPGGMSSYDFKTIMLKSGKGYRGPAEFMKSGQIKDLRKCYSEGGLFYGKKDPYFFTESSISGTTTIHIKNHLKEELARLIHFNGYGCMRYDDPLTAQREISSYAKLMGWDLEIVIAHTNIDKKPKGSPDQRPVDSLFQAWHYSINRKKSVLVIFQNALRAGYDFDRKTPSEVIRKIKESLVFFYETTDSNWNSHLQGGPGRCAGYHNNEMVHIYANIELVQLYTDWYDGTITLEELDIKIMEVERAKNPKYKVSPATHVITTTKSSRTKTWMEAFPLDKDYATQLRKMPKRLEAIGGYEAEPLITIIDSFIKDNEENFRNLDPSRIVRANTNTILEGGKYHMNSRTWSNIQDPDDRDSMLKEIEFIIANGKINREKIKTPKESQRGITVAIMVYDDPILINPQLYLCLLNGQVEKAYKEFSLKDKTLWKDTFFEDKI